MALLAATAPPFVTRRDGRDGTPLEAAVLRIALDYELFELQDAPMETALRAMSARTGRYCPALLSTFADLLRVG